MEIPVYFHFDRSRDEFIAVRDLVVLPRRAGCQVDPYPAENRGFVELDYRFQTHHYTNDAP